MICNGCGEKVPEHETTLHDATCCPTHTDTCNFGRAHGICTAELEEGQKP